jgi:hypothetical protein
MEKLILLHESPSKNAILLLHHIGNITTCNRLKRSIDQKVDSVSFPTGFPPKENAI